MVGIGSDTERPVDADNHFPYIFRLYLAYI